MGFAMDLVTVEFVVAQVDPMAMVEPAEHLAVAVVAAVAAVAA